MTRRYRYAAALVCLAALVMALGVPTVGLPVWGLGEPIATVAAPAGATVTATDRSDRTPCAVCVRALVPRGPPHA